MRGYVLITYIYIRHMLPAARNSGCLLLLLALYTEPSRSMHAQLPSILQSETIRPRFKLRV